MVLVIVLSALLLVGSALAAVSDVRTGHIRNFLTYGLAVVAVAAHAFAGPIDAAVAILCMMAVLAAGLPAFAAGWVKGGDIKMIVACAGIVSVQYLIPFLLWTMLAGGLVSLVAAWRYGTLRRSLRTVGQFAHPLLHGIVPMQLPYATHTVPYGLAIFGGSLVTALSMTLAAGRTF